MKRVALICDFEEEGWHSMNLVADQLYAQLRGAPADVSAARIRPPMARYASRLAGLSRKPLWNFDRLVNRLWRYPSHVRKLRNRFDVFHVVDHSYSHLVHELPAAQTVVTCHDLDTFRSVLEPDTTPRSYPFRRMTERILAGFRKAAHVVCVSHTTRDELLRFNVVPAERTSVVYNGINPVFRQAGDEASNAALAGILGPATGPELLHVGSTIPRKRIDLLLEIFARVRQGAPAARLLRAGGSLTPAQRALAGQLGVSDGIVELPYLSEPMLAALYRRAAVVIQPSESEGFGLPVAEALACGAVVVATDLPVLREIGGEAVFYCPLGDLEAWRQRIESLLSLKEANPVGWSETRARSASQSGQFAWDEAARRMVELYRKLS